MKVFDAMRWAAQQGATENPPQWQPGGNSFAQFQAREVADAILGYDPKEAHEAANG